MLIVYTYSVGGVGYAISPDIAELRAAIEVDPEKLIGCPVTISTPFGPAKQDAHITN